MKRRCHQVPRLPRKVPRRPGRLTATKHATRASPVPQVPHLPRQTQVDVAKCHACHAHGTSMSPWANATPATQMKRGCHQVPRLPRKCQCVTKLCGYVCVEDGVWQSCVWNTVCDKVVCDKVMCGKGDEKDGVCVTKFRVKDNVWQSCVCVTKWCVTKVVTKMVCDKVVCACQSGVWQSCVCVTKLCERQCVTKLRLKDNVWQSDVWQRWCVTKLCVKESVWQSCVCVCVCEKMVCDKVWVERWCVTMLCGGSGGGGGGAGNKNPTQRCGEIERPGNCILILDVHHLAHKNWKGNAVNIFQTCPGAAFPSHVALPGNSSHAIFSPYPSSMAQLWNCVIILCIQPPRPPCGHCTGPRQGRP